MPTAPTPDLAEAPVTARMRAAHEGVYRWPEAFSGFSAYLLVQDGVQENPGRIVARVGVEPEITFRDPGPVADWARGELAMMIAHRAPRSFEQADGRYGHRAGERHDGALRIHIEDSLSSSYLVDDDGRILEVSRAPAATTFTIRVLETVTAPVGGWISRVFSVSFWEPEGVLDRVQTYQDDHVALDGVLVPARRHVVTTDRAGVGARTITLSGHAGIGAHA